MQLHPNAKLAPAQRLLLVQRVRQDRWRVTEAAEAAGVSRQTAYKWLQRYEEGGAAVLLQLAPPRFQRGPVALLAQ